MYIYCGKHKGLDKFEVIGNDRLRLLNLYENNIIDIENLEYNPKFTKVSVSLTNPYSLCFKIGCKYGLLIEKKGIACFWIKSVPRYERWFPTSPTKDTILKLGLELNKEDVYQYEPAEPVYLLPDFKRKRNNIDKKIYISKYGEYEKIHLN